MPRTSSETPFSRYLSRPTSRRRFAVVVETYRDVVYGAALRLTGNATDAADITQDVFLALMTRPPAVGSVTSPAGYLTYRVLTLTERAQRTAKRRRARERVAVERLLAENADDADALDTDAVLRAVAELPDRQRRAIELTYLLELPRQEVAAALDVGERTLAYDLAKARESLRRRLGKTALISTLTGLSTIVSDSAYAAASAPPALVSSLERLVRFGDILAPAAVQAETPTALAGGLIVSKTTTVAAAVAVAALALGVWWIQGRDWMDTPVLPGAPDAALVVDAEELDTKALETQEEPAAAPDPAAAPPAVDFEEFDRDRDVAGFVRDSAGGPVAGARVSVRDESVARVMDLTLRDPVTPPPTRLTTTAADGSFTLRLERGEETHVRASAPGYGTTHAPNVLAGQLVEIKLAPAARLEVRAIDEGEKPVAEAEVRVWRRSNLDVYDEREERTDSSGIATFDLLAPGELYLSVSHARLGSPGWQRPVLEAGETTHLELVLISGRTLRGRIVDADSGEPIASARIGADWTQSRPTRTDADGRYEYPGWTGNGRRSLVATAKGYGRVGQRVGASDELNFELPPAYEAHGRVIDATGKALSGVRVSAMASQFSNAGQETDSDTARSGEDGRFAFSSLHPKWPYTLTFQQHGFGRYLLDIDASLARDGVVGLGDVTLTPGQSIEGVLLGEDGEGLGETIVELDGHNRDRGELRESEEYAVHGYVGTESRQTDDLGRFRFPDLSPGAYILRVRSNERGPQARQPIELPVELVAGKDLLDVRIEMNEAFSTLFRVRDALGGPVANARVFLFWPSTRESLTARTDDSGDAKLIHNRENTGAKYRVRTPVGYAPEDTAGQLHGQAEVPIVLERRAMIAGIVRDPTGAPLSDRPVEVSLDGVTRRPVYTDAEGRFTVGAEAGVSVELRLASTYEDPDSGSVRFMPWRAVRKVSAPAEGVELVASPRLIDGVLAFRVVGPDGAPVEGAVIGMEVLQQFRDESEAVSTGSDGRVRLEGLPREPVQVRDVRAEGGNDGYFLYRTAFETNPSPDGQEILVKLARYYIAFGFVRSPDGEPVAGAEIVVLRDDGAEVSRVSSRKEGYFALHLADGPQYTLSARAGSASAKLAIDGPRMGIEMQLEPTPASE